MKFKEYITEARQMLKQWKDYISRNPELKAGVKILSVINKKGYKAYIVGGSVRDIILGDLKPHDIDINTNCPPDVLSTLYKLHPIGSSGDFGIWVIKQDGYSFEIAQFRGESYIKPKYVRKILK